MDVGTELASILGVNGMKLNPDPFPHLVVDAFFAPGFFQQLKAEFPSIEKTKRKHGWGQSLYWGDDAYHELMKTSRAWKRAHDFVHSQTFVDFVISEFDEYWEREGCIVDLQKARFVPYLEDRIDKERYHLRKVDHKPEELFCRLDLYQSWDGYYRPVHLDHRRRLISMLVYFDDPAEIGMHGGELILHPPAADLDFMEKLGCYHAPKLFSKLRDKVANTTVVKPMPNRMAVFPCGRKSWHSVPSVRTERSPRAHIQITISSQSAAWA